MVSREIPWTFYLRQNHGVLHHSQCRAMCHNLAMCCNFLFCPVELCPETQHTSNYTSHCTGVIILCKMTGLLWRLWELPERGHSSAKLQECEEISDSWSEVLAMKSRLGYVNPWNQELGSLAWIPLLAMEQARTSGAKRMEIERFLTQCQIFKNSLEPDSATPPSGYVAAYSTNCHTDISGTTNRIRYYSTWGWVAESIPYCCST